MISPGLRSDSVGLPDGEEAVRMAQPPLQVSSVTIAAPNPRELATFYQRLLGWFVSALEDPRPGEPPQAGWAQLRYPSAGPGLMTLNIEFEKEYVRPVWRGRHSRHGTGGRRCGSGGLVLWPGCCDRTHEAGGPRRAWPGVAAADGRRGGGGQGAVPAADRGRGRGGCRLPARRPAGRGAAAHAGAAYRRPRPGGPAVRGDRARVRMDGPAPSR